MNSLTQQIEIINSKIQIPHLPKTIVRKRLYRLLDRLDGMKAVFVIAGAGYGKTTLAAQICRDFNLRTVWYRLDPSDADFITFIQYLIAGLRQYYKDLGSRTIETINDAENFGIKQGKIIAALANEIDSFVDQDITLVLDDFHLVQGQNDIVNIMGFLFEHLTPFVHFIIISRTDPELNHALSLCRKINNTTWVVSEKSWILPLLVTLYSKGEKKNYIIKLIIQFGLDAYYQLRKIEIIGSKPEQ